MTSSHDFTGSYQDKTPLAELTAPTLHRRRAESHSRGSAVLARHHSHQPTGAVPEHNLATNLDTSKSSSSSLLSRRKHHQHHQSDRHDVRSRLIQHAEDGSITPTQRIDRLRRQTSHKDAGQTESTASRAPHTRPPVTRTSSHAGRRVAHDHHHDGNDEVEQVVQQRRVQKLTSSPSRLREVQSSCPRHSHRAHSATPRHDKNGTVLGSVEEMNCKASHRDKNGNAIHGTHSMRCIATHDGMHTDSSRHINHAKHANYAQQQHHPHHCHHESHAHSAQHHRAHHTDRSAHADDYSVAYRVGDAEKAPGRLSDEDVAAAEVVRGDEMPRHESSRRTPTPLSQLEMALHVPSHARATAHTHYNNHHTLRYDDAAAAAAHLPMPSSSRMSANGAKAGTWSSLSPNTKRAAPAVAHANTNTSGLVALVTTQDSTLDQSRNGGHRHHRHYNPNRSYSLLYSDGYRDGDETDMRYMREVCCPDSATANSAASVAARPQGCHHCGDVQAQHYAAPPMNLSLTCGCSSSLCRTRCNALPRQTQQQRVQPRYTSSPALRITHSAAHSHTLDNAALLPPAHPGAAVYAHARNAVPTSLSRSARGEYVEQLEREVSVLQEEQTETCAMLVELAFGKDMAMLTLHEHRGRSAMESEAQDGFVSLLWIFLAVTAPVRARVPSANAPGSGDLGYRASPQATATVAPAAPTNTAAGREVEETALLTTLARTQTAPSTVAAQSARDTLKSQSSSPDCESMTTSDAVDWHSEWQKMQQRLYDTGNAWLAQSQSFLTTLQEKEDVALGAMELHTHLLRVQQQQQTHHRAVESQREALQLAQEQIRSLRLQLRLQQSQQSSSTLSASAQSSSSGPVLIQTPAHLGNGRNSMSNNYTSNNSSRDNPRYADSPHNTRVAHTHVSSSHDNVSFGRLYSSDAVRYGNATFVPSRIRRAIAPARRSPQELREEAERLHVPLVARDTDVSNRATPRHTARAVTDAAAADSSVLSPQHFAHDAGNARNSITKRVVGGDGSNTNNSTGEEEQEEEDDTRYNNIVRDMREDGMSDLRRTNTSHDTEEKGKSKRDSDANLRSAGLQSSQNKNNSSNSYDHNKDNARSDNSSLQNKKKESSAASSGSDDERAKPPQSLRTNVSTVPRNNKFITGTVDRTVQETKLLPFSAAAPVAPTPATTSPLLLVSKNATVVPVIRHVQLHQDSLSDSSSSSSSSSSAPSLPRSGRPLSKKHTLRRTDRFTASASAPFTSKDAVVSPNAPDSLKVQSSSSSSYPTNSHERASNNAAASASAASGISSRQSSKKHQRPRNSTRPPSRGRLGQPRRKNSLSLRSTCDESSAAGSSSSSSSSNSSSSSSSSSRGKSHEGENSNHKRPSTNRTQHDTIRGHSHPRDVVPSSTLQRHSFDDEDESEIEKGTTRTGVTQRGDSTKTAVLAPKATSAKSTESLSPAQQQQQREAEGTTQLTRRSSPSEDVASASAEGSRLAKSVTSISSNASAKTGARRGLKLPSW